MNEFMQQPGHMPQQQDWQAVADRQMQQMLLEKQINRQQQQRMNGNNSWASEFEPGLAEQKPGAFNAAEFERFAQMKQAGMEGRPAEPVTAGGMPLNGYQSSMGMGYGNSMYGGMGGLGMGMMGMQRPYGGISSMQDMPQQQQQQQPEGKGKSRMVELDEKDWEAQFAQLDVTDQDAVDALDEQANKAMEDQLGEIDRLVPESDVGTLSDDHFETAWQKAQAEINANHREFTSRSDDINENFADWENFDMNTHFPRDPELGNYTFEPDNIFTSVNDPFEEGVRIMEDGGNLSLAALAFEAAVQKDPQHVEAWTRLGAVQAQNEKETPAIRALEQATKLDPANLDALMGLAVSYTNEGYDTTAYRTLERWLSVKYPSVVPPRTEQDDLNDEITFTDRHNLHQRVTDLFINAAQLSPDATRMDADVQVGLGVLFYGAEEYDKAVDCFSSALQSNESASLTHAQSLNQRPLLWNRLGATLANSGRSEEAIHAYEKALELNPNFVRARYNLGVSCINIGCLPEAAQHLLGALDMHKMVEREGREKAREIVEGANPGKGAAGVDEFEKMIRANQSTNLYDTLRRVFGQMDRRDLADKVGPGMDPMAFRNEFEF